MAGIIEVFLITASFFLVFASKGLSLPLAFLLSAIAMQCLIVAILKISFWLKFYSLLEKHKKIITLLVIAIFSIVLLQNIGLVSPISSLLTSLATASIIFYLVGLVILYIFLQSILSPVVGGDTLAYNAGRLFLFRQEKTLYPKNNYTNFQQLVFPLNADLFMLWFLKNGKDYGLGLLSFFAYLQIIFGTFILVSNLYSSTIAYYSTFFIASLSVIILNASNTKNGIVAAAYALSSILFLWLSVSYSPIFIIWLLLSLSFGLDAKSTFYPFAFGLMIITPLYLLANNINLSSLLAPDLLFKVLLLLPLLIIVSPLYLFWKNYRNFGSIFGDKSYCQRESNPDGFRGMIVNIFRYSVEMLDYVIPLAGRRFKLSWIPGAMTKLVNTFAKKIGGRVTAGASSYWAKLTPFKKIDGGLHPDTAWYGPLGVLLFIPALFYGLAAPNNLLALFSSLLAIFLLLSISLKVTWVPWNGRFFMIFFVSIVPALGGFLVEYGSKLYLYPLLFLAIFTALVTTIFNIKKPLIDTKFSTKGAWFRGIKNRIYYASQSLMQYEYWKMADLLKKNIFGQASMVAIVPSTFKNYLISEPNRNIKAYYIVDTQFDTPDHPANDPIPGNAKKYLINGKHINVKKFIDERNLDVGYVLNLSNWQIVPANNYRQIDSVDCFYTGDKTTPKITARLFQKTTPA